MDGMIASMINIRIFLVVYGIKNAYVTVVQYHSDSKIFTSKIRK